ncbi:uncharacterized protein LOC134695302 [Mytilus trossulus]|uniref:uncharacterized protein LOC134695302 n=1 Tax=Mytilus trossulus TaxID=6551 RepID=UPI0030057DE7
MFNRFRKQEQEVQGQIKLGTRVIRGPNWIHKCEDNGEGFLGTIVKFNLFERLIEVIWDSGRSGQYRADPEKYDLRIFDNAPAGELHHGTMCQNCSDSPIHGMKWTCIKCKIDMCTQCYMSDYHDDTHAFERTYTSESRGHKILPKNSCNERVMSKGIFEGAEVVAASNLMHDFEIDGGDVGYVEEITSWQNKYHRGSVGVFWKASNRIQFYRLGAEGCVDVFCSRLTEPASGGTCYVDKLPVVDFDKVLFETPNLVTSTSGLSTKVRKSDKKSAPILLSQLAEEHYPHFESRIVLVGEPGTGKTSIAKYLSGKQPNRFRMSTDGKQLYTGLAYIDIETEEWLCGQQDFSLEEIILSRTFLQENKRKNIVKLPDTTPTSEDVLDENVTTLSEHENVSSDLHVQLVTNYGVMRKLQNVFSVTKGTEEVKFSITKEIFLEMYSQVGKTHIRNKKIAPMIIYDFPRHDVFYSSHQTYLAYGAVYIIVLDGSKQLDDPCSYEQYLPGKSGHKTSRDYLLYWVNTIVTYCRGSVYDFPKIMIVLTHKDQVQANEIEKRRHEIFGEINKMFQQTPLGQHLVIEDKIFVNAKDKHDTEMEKIKEVIIRESERQPTWGELLPKCFIPLELEFASLTKRNIMLITLEHLKKINSLQPIRPLSEDELKVFLKFQHSIGKLLYFDKLKLDDRIVLSPTLLIDAFQSIVTDRRFCNGDRHREEIWDAMGMQGVVFKQEIYEVWKRKKYAKFNKEKEYLLAVMTHLDILVEPKRYDSSRTRIPADFYYVASMVRDIDDSGYLQSASITKRNIALAFQSSSLMIPPALSFRFISYCLSVWAVQTYGETNRDMLFHRSGVFTIDPSLDMYILCEDDKISVRLVHTRTNTLIMRGLASSINECLTSALEKISQLYIRTSSDQNHTSDAFFVTSVCCNSPDKPCILPFENLAYVDKIWTCPAHGIEHPIHIIKSWIPGKLDNGLLKNRNPIRVSE